MQVGPQLGQQNQLDMREDEDSAPGRGDNGRSPGAGGGGGPGKGDKDVKGAWMPGIESALATGAGEPIFRAEESTLMLGDDQESFFLLLLDCVITSGAFLPRHRLLGALSALSALLRRPPESSCSSEPASPHRYKWEVLRKMRRAFAKGYDPVLELASASMTDHEGNQLPGRVNRKEAEYIRRVVNGESGS